jgi:predicted porin
MADSSVTIYGQANAALEWASSGSKDTGTAGKVSQWKIDGGSNLETPSRLGFKGNADIGGGVASFFQVETSLFTDNGADNGGTKLGDRELWVGLQGSSMGKIELGHGKTPYVNLADVEDSLVIGANNLAIYNIGINNLAAGSVGNQYQMGNYVNYGATTAANTFTKYTSLDTNGVITKRPPNGIRYDSPDFDGFKFATYLGLGENKTATTSETTDFSLGANYTNGPFFVGAAYQSDNNLPNGALNNAKSQAFLLTGTFKLDDWMIGVGGQSAKQSVPGYSVTQTAFQLFSTYAIGPVTLKGGLVDFGNVKFPGGVTAGTSTGDLRYMVGANYYFSKTTFGFVEFAGDSNRGKMLTADATQPKGTVIDAPSPAALSVGLSYAF